jgi:phosphate-selective porin
MKKIYLSLILTALAAAATADTFTGTITDTMCGANHTMMKDHPPEQCIKMCTKGRYEYALFDGTNVIKLSDQKASAKFAAQKVRVTGTLDPKTNTIKVSSIGLSDDK